MNGEMGTRQPCTVIIDQSVLYSVGKYLLCYNTIGLCSIPVCLKSANQNTILHYSSKCVLPSQCLRVTSQGAKDDREGDQPWTCNLKMLLYFNKKCSVVPVCVCVCVRCLERSQGWRKLTPTFKLVLKIQPYFLKKCFVFPVWVCEMPRKDPRMEEGDTSWACSLVF